ncbi:MAG: 50S ribosomal protein L3 [Candidatus Diapherotrites archaeon]
MTRKHKPRSGSLAFYPRKRAKSEKPLMRAFKRDGETVKVLNFYGYKAGMTHVTGINQHQKSHMFGQKTVVPVTLIECPPIRITGFRAYGSNPYGEFAISEEWAKELPKEISRTIAGKKEAKKKEKESTENNKEKAKKGIEKIMESLAAGEVKEIRLIGCLRPDLTGIGKKKPEIVELFLDGTPEKQFEFAKQFLGKDVSASDVFNAGDFLDVCAITTGKGFSGVVKRAGVKSDNRKAKKERIVGSIGPWHPPTVMFTVARAGQLGYHKRTEFNKKLLKIDSDQSINPKSGFKHYGLIKNPYLIVEGSIAGPVKRCVEMRKGIRPKPLEKVLITEVDFIASKA